MTTTENSIRRTYLSRFGIDLLEMTTIGNKIVFGNVLFYGISLLEMTTNENNSAEKDSKRIGYLPA